MSIAVVYEEEHELYGQHHARIIHSVVVQHEAETDKDFYVRIKVNIAALESCYSYYEYEIVDVLHAGI